MESFKAVPQLFFDFIARMVPGAVALLAMSYGAGESLLRVSYDFMCPPETTSSALVFAMFAAVSTYVVGHVLRPMAEWLQRRPLKTFFSMRGHMEDALTSTGDGAYPQKMKTVLLGALGAPGADEYERAFWICYDWLRYHRPDAGALAVKARAESIMWMSIAVALLAGVAVHVAVAWESGARLSFYFLLISAFLAVASCSCGVSTFAILHRCVIHFFYVAHTPPVQEGGLMLSAAGEQDQSA